MGRKKLSEEERLQRRRLRDRLRKRKIRAGKKREEEMIEDFLGEMAGVKTVLPNGDHMEKRGQNPDKVKRCPRCGHLKPFCSCARDEDGNLKKADGWLTSPVG